ncbi:MipA/OmpV family protein [Aureivirga sp. CE67]|uniref:MipA/OmpV family protein n=1 Tax=Aureivirga sp. CE67 TaxID=1788983 RepID=UPI0018C9CC49|nr:MipA/OmpV family protein [Aureivirga sp. CE67]
MKKDIKVYLLCFIISLFSISKINAQNAETTPKKIQFSAGFGLASFPTYEGSDENLILPSVYFSADWNKGQYIRMSVAGIEANLLPSKKWSFGPRLTFRTPRNEDWVDNEFINELEDIDLATSLGLFTRYRFKKMDAKIEYTQDISGVHEGGVGRLDLGYTCRKGKWITRLSASTSFATKNYMETYFGLNGENIGTSTMDYYYPEAGIKDVGAGIRTTYVMSRKWMLVGSINYTRLLGDAVDSPIVELGNENQIAGTLMAIYRF